MDLRGLGLSEDADDGGVDPGKPDQPPPDEQEAGVSRSLWRRGSAGWSRDTIGYNPRSKIIEGGSWTRVNPQLCTKAESGVGGVSQYQPVLL